MADQLELDFCVIAASEHDADGHLTVQPDYYGDGSGANVESLAPFGLASRPLDPVRAEESTQDGCVGLLIREGGRISVMPLVDARVAALLPHLKKGGSMLYCASGSYALFDGEDPDGVKRPGSFTLGVKYKKGGKGKSHLFQMSCAVDGEEHVSLKHAEGHGLSMTDGGKYSAVLKNRSGNRFIEVNDDEVVIAGKTKIVGNFTAGDLAAARPMVTWDGFAAWAAMIEAKLAGLGQAVAVPMSSAKDLVATRNLKGS